MNSKKELKAAYKLKIPVAGVFQLENKKNGKVLIESSTNVSSKWNRHRTELRFGSHRNTKLQKDWNDHGEENFMFSILSELEFKEDDNFDINKEVELLQEMVEDEMEVKEDMKY